LIPESLARLAADGLDGLSQTLVREVAGETWAWGVATADARYCVVARSLEMIDAWFDEYGAMDGRFVHRLSHIMRVELPSVLDASPEVGCAIASTLHERLVAERTLASDVLKPLYDAFEGGGAIETS
jgi:hypothetical protein